MNIEKIFQATREIFLLGEKFCVVTLIATEGHAPSDPGSKAMITMSGLYEGTVGGGKVEAKVIETAKRLLQEKTGSTSPHIISWNLQKDIGMTCGGVVTFLFEIFHSQKWPITIFGAGHVAQAVIKFLMELDCQITCIDPRQDWLDKLPESFKVKKKLEYSLTNLHEKMFFVVMTQGHATDIPILEMIFKNFPEAPYIGVIGSETKAIRIKRELENFGIGKNTLDKLHCPMGLPIGNNSPEEIAISIIGQLIQKRDLKNK